MPGFSTWSDHLFLKLTNVASFALFFGSSVYGAIEGSNGNKETYFTPADWSLHLWTIINFLFLGYIIFQFFDESHSSIHGVGYRFALTGVLNSIFVHTYTTHHYLTAFIFALLTASTASSVYYSLRQNYPSKGTLDTVFVHLPFSLFHSYSIVLVLISAFALFTTGLKTPESHHPGFTVKLLVLIAEGFLAVTALGYAFSKREGDLAGAFVMAWFLYGIYDHQVNHTIKYFALGASIVASFAVLKALWFTFASESGAVVDEERAPLIGSS